MASALTVARLTSRPRRAIHHTTSSERRGRRDDRRAEQQQRRVEDRLRLHVDFDARRPARQPLRQRLLPLEDVAALDLAGRRVVEDDLARQVQPEGDELVAGPPDPLASSCQRRSDDLPELEQIAAAVETIRRPGKRGKPRQAAGRRPPSR